MVFVRNICMAQKELNDDEMVCLLTKTNRKVFIEKDDVLTIVNGDLKIEKSSCYCYIDCAEVEACLISKEKIIRGAVNGN